jgi:ribosomal protein S14
MTIKKIIKKTLINNVILNNNKFLEENSYDLGSKYHYKNNHYRILCILSSRQRAVFKNFRLTRMSFRSFADLGYLSGLRRAS